MARLILGAFVILGLIAACTRASGFPQVEIRNQGAPDGAQCYLFFQNGELKSGNCK